MKKSAVIGMVAMVMLLAILSGCATTSFFEVFDLNAATDESKRICAEPYCSVGILENSSLAKGNANAVIGTYPDIRFGEFFPGRVSNYCWSITKDGLEALCQTVLYDLNFDGEFMEAVLIESEKTEKVIILSTFLEYGYDLDGKEFSIDREKFLKDGHYRRKLLREKGSSIDSRPQVRGLIESIKKWNRFETPEGILLTPLGEEELKLISSINIQFKYIDKLVGTGRFSLVPDATGTVAGLIIDLVKARTAPTYAWSFGSLVERRQMALIIESVGKMRKDLIEIINKNNAVSLKMAENNGGEK